MEHNCINNAISNSVMSWHYILLYISQKIIIWSLTNNFLCASDNNRLSSNENGRKRKGSNQERKSGGNSKGNKMEEKNKASEMRGSHKTSPAGSNIL